MTARNLLARGIAVALASAVGPAGIAAQSPAPRSADAIFLTTVTLPGGTAVLGNTGATVGEAHERPVHEVELAPFAIGTHEVTQAQFEAVMGYNPSFDRDPARPVEQVSWYDAVRFCNVLSRLEGLAPAYAIHPFDGYALDAAADGYRLPSEAEWAYAAKAGTRADTYAGELAAADGTSEMLEPIAWYDAGDGEPRTRPAGQKRPNALGLYDVLGNVFEWTGDAFAAYPGGRIDPDAPGADRAPQLRVLRGGAMDARPTYVRAAYRYRLHPSYTSYNVGFRVARSVRR